MLEAALHDQNAFVTLTYDDENIPEDMNLDPDHPKLWLKRLRKRISPVNIRFYLVGEYGEKTQRPHYHAAIFGYPTCQRGQTRTTRDARICCINCEIIRQSWGKGNVYLGSLETSSAQYIANYTTKGMTIAGSYKLHGRHPEFSRKSNRPGLGRDAMFDVAHTLMQYDLDTSETDVPHNLRHGKKQMPLGRYLRRNLRKMIGKDEKISQAAFNEINQQMLPMRAAAITDKEDPSLKSHLLKANKGKVASLEAREKIFKQRKTL